MSLYLETGGGRIKFAKIESRTFSEDEAKTGVIGPFNGQSV